MLFESCSNWYTGNRAMVGDVCFHQEKVIGDFWEAFL